MLLRFPPNSWIARARWSLLPTNPVWNKAVFFCCSTSCLHCGPLSAHRSVAVSVIGRFLPEIQTGLANDTTFATFIIIQTHRLSSVGHGLNLHCVISFANRLITDLWRRVITKCYQSMPSSITSPANLIIVLFWVDFPWWSCETIIYIYTIIYRHHDKYILWCN